MNLSLKDLDFMAPKLSLVIKYFPKRNNQTLHIIFLILTFCNTKFMFVFKINGLF